MATKPKLSSFPVLEESLGKKLKAAWVKQAKALQKDMIAAYEESGSVDAAISTLKEMDLGGLIDEASSFIDYIFTSALLLGSSWVGGLENSKYLNGALPSVMDDAKAQFKNALQYNAEDMIRTAAISAFGSETQTFQKSECPCCHPAFVYKAEMDLADKLNAAVNGTGAALIDIGANLATSRLISYGFLDQCVKEGYTEFQVTEVLDTATCPVCRIMHGKTFRVETAMSNLRTILSVQDPNSLKSIAPWPSQSKDAVEELRNMSVEDLERNSWNIPPYHPGCRGTTAMVGTVEPLPVPAPDPELTDALASFMLPSTAVAYSSKYEPIPLSTFEETGALINAASMAEQLVNVVDAYTGNSHFAMNALLRMGASAYTADAALAKYVKTNIDLMDDAIELGKLVSDTMLYRGVRSGVFPSSYSEMVGKEFTDLGFLSTTASQEVAKDFASQGSDALGVVVAIQARKGMKAVVPASIPGVMVTAEYEVILQRGLTFKVVSYTEGLTPTLLVEVVDVPEKPPTIKKAETTSKTPRFVWTAGDLLFL